jgi:hypothetical protein
MVPFGRDDTATRISLQARLGLGDAMIIGSRIARPARCAHCFFSIPHSVGIA